MTFVQLFPAILAAIVLGAHFLRAGHPALVLASLCLIVLLFVRRPWAARVVQAGLCLGTLEWLHTLTVLVTLRMQSGEPFTRLAIILGSVAAVTALSAVLFQTRTLRQRFHLGASTPPQTEATAA